MVATRGIRRSTGRLQVLRDFSSFSVADGKSDQSKKDSPVYVGVESHTYRIEDKNEGKENKMREMENL